MTFRANRPKKQPDVRQLLSYATWLLARQDYSRASLLDKFKTRFIEDENIFVQALDKLGELGLQSDERFAESYVQSKFSWGGQRLRLEMMRKGIEKELIEAAIEQHLDEAPRCAEVLATKLRGQPVPEDYKERQKLLAFLVRRGFGLDTAKHALRDAQ